MAKIFSKALMAVSDSARNSLLPLILLVTTAVVICAKKLLHRYGPHHSGAQRL